LPPIPNTELAHWARVEFSAEGTRSIQSGTAETLLGLRWNFCSIRLTLMRRLQSTRQFSTRDDARDVFGWQQDFTPRGGWLLFFPAGAPIANRQRSRSQALDVASVKSKLYFNTNLHTHWSAVFQCRIEAPLFHGLHCLGIQTEPKSVDHSNVARMSGCVDNQP
jgi:hypothetical protein